MGAWTRGGIKRGEGLRNVASRESEGGAWEARLPVKNNAGIRYKKRLTDHMRQTKITSGY